MRFAKSFRYIISQRLLPRKGGQGRVAAIEILKSTMRTREYVERGESEGKSLVDAMRDGSTEGMQHFDAELERIVRDGIIDLQTAYAFATNVGNFRLQMADFAEAQGEGNSRNGAARKAPAAKPAASATSSSSPQKSMLDGLEIER